MLGGRFSVFLGKGGSGLYLLPCYIHIIRLHLHQNWGCGEKAPIHFQLVLCIFAAADFQSSQHSRRMHASWVNEVHISSNFWLLQCSLGLDLPPRILYGLYSLVVTLSHLVSSLRLFSRPQIQPEGHGQIRAVNSYAGFTEFDRSPAFLHPDSSKAKRVQQLIVLSPRV